MALPGPEQVLRGAGQHLDRLGELRVTGDLSMVVAIGAHEIGEHLGIAAVGLRARYRMPVAISADGIRVDCVDGVTRSDEALDQQAAVRFDADDNARGILSVSAHKLLDAAQPFGAVRHARRS